LTNPPPPGWGYPPPSAGNYPPPYGGYPPAGSYPPPYGGYPAPPGTNGLAIASLVVSLASPLLCSLLSIVGIVLGVVALNQIKQTGQQGRGLALGGIIVGIVLIVLTIVVIIVYIAYLSSAVSSGH
jgi:Domain of unknown function (DUF4190)